MWLSDALCGTAGPGEAPHRSLWVQARSPKGAKCWGSGPSGGCTLWKEAGEAPVPTKCCLSASGRGAGAESQGYVNSNEEEDKTPETLIKHRPTEQCPQEPASSSRSWCRDSAPRLRVASGRRLLPSPGRARAKRTSGRRASSGRRGFGDKCGAGRAGMSGEGGVSRQSRDGGRCRGVLLPAGLAGLPVLPQEPLHQGWGTDPSLGPELVI